jgi:hypothetical protein
MHGLLIDTPVALTFAFEGCVTALIGLRNLGLVCTLNIFFSFF